MVRVGSLTSGFDHDLHYLISDRVHANSSYEVLIHALSRPTAPEHATRTCEATVDTLLRAHPLHRVSKNWLDSRIDGHLCTA